MQTIKTTGPYTGLCHPFNKLFCDGKITDLRRGDIFRVTDDQGMVDFILILELTPEAIEYETVAGAQHPSNIFYLTNGPDAPPIAEPSATRVTLAQALPELLNANFKSQGFDTFIAHRGKGYQKTVWTHRRKHGQKN